MYLRPDYLLRASSRYPSHHYRTGGDYRCRLVLWPFRGTHASLDNRLLHRAEHQYLEIEKSEVKRLTRLEGALTLVVAFRMGRGVVCVDVDAMSILCD